MQLLLVVPGLLDFPATVLASCDTHGRTLARLLASGHPALDEQDGGIASACRACGIGRQCDWPVAPRLARAMGVDPGEAFWLCGDPSTLSVGADDVRLSGLVEDLSLADAQELVAALNGHFAPDGVRFIAARPAQWLVRVSQAQRITTRPPEAAIGAPLFGLLASGPDAARWRRWQNEVQMLFFEHPVNLRRQQAGGAPASSVWFWGGGIEKSLTASTRSLFAHDQRIVELARGCTLACEPTPPDFGALPRSDAAAVWLDAIDSDNAQQALATIEQNWMVPVERALRTGRISALEVVIAGRDRALRFMPKRSALAWRWRARWSPPRLSQYLASAARSGS